MAYNAGSIKVLKGLEPIRLKYGLYIGDNDSKGLWIAFRELIANAFDEASSGYADTVSVGVLPNQSYWVYDSGRGIPVEKHPTEKIPTIQVVFCQLHAGGKMDKKSTTYKKSAGTFGLGASISNALATSLKVWTYRKAWWCIEFTSGGAIKKVLHKAKPPRFASNKKGTYIEYTPDYAFFQDAKIDNASVLSFLDLSSYFNPGVNVEFFDGKKAYKFKRKGVYQLVEKQCKDLKANVILDAEPFQLVNNVITCVLQWTDYTESALTTYASGSPTSNGGTHLNGLHKALWEALVTSKKVNLEYSDFEVGIVGVLDANVVAPTFSGQTKNRLASPEITGIVYDQLAKPLKAYFRKNSELAKLLLQKAIQVRKAFEQFKISKAVASKLDPKKNALPSVLALSDAKCPVKDRELFLLEGESAAGTAKQARNNSFQEVLPLRGKVLNVYQDKGKTFSSKSIQDILLSVGWNPANKDDPYKSIRVGKIILLVDADPDGGHLSVLLLGLFHRILPDLIKRGMLYIIDPVLYTAEYKNVRYYGKDIRDLQSQIKGTFPEGSITRIKGWGEVSANVLKVIAMDPKKRKLIRVMPVDSQGDKEFVGIVSEDSSVRKKLLGI